MLLAFLGSGCSKRDITLRDDTSDRIRIRLSAELPDTKNAIGSLEDLNALPEKFGIYGADTRRSDATARLGAEWGLLPRMDNVQVAGIDPLGRITLKQDYTYDPDENMWVKFCAYSPYVSNEKTPQGGSYIEAPAAGRAPALHFVLTGKQDLMWASPVIGNKLTVPGGLAFKHLLTQLSFQIVDLTGTMQGHSLEAIIFSGVTTACTVDLETGKMGEWTLPTDDVTLSIPEPVLITGSADIPQALGGEVMLPPGREYFTIRIVTDKDVYRNIRIVPAPPDTQFQAGKAYLITLSFNVSDQPGGNQADIQVGVSLKPWEKGGYGDADV